MPRIVLLLSSIAAALLLASGVGLLNAVKPAESTFPGLNGKIAFASDGQIYTINPDGTDRFQVTQGDQYEEATAEASNPSFSPNGNRIVYYGYTDSVGGTVYSVNSSVGPETTISGVGYEDNGPWSYSPSYAPSGTKIVFSAGFDYDFPDETQSDIYTVNTDGMGKTQLTNNEENDFYPESSPNGQRVAFSRWDGHDSEIYTMSASGGNVVRVTKTSGMTLNPPTARTASG